MLAKTIGSINDSSEKQQLLAQRLSPFKNICNKLARYFVSFTRYSARGSLLRDLFLAIFIARVNLIVDSENEQQADDSTLQNEVGGSSQQQVRVEAEETSKSGVGEQLYEDNKSQGEVKFYKKSFLLALLKYYIGDDKDVFLITKQFKAAIKLQDFHDERAEALAFRMPYKHKVVIPFVVEKVINFESKVVKSIVVYINYHDEDGSLQIYYFDPLKQGIDNAILKRLKSLDFFRNRAQDISKFISTEQTNCGMWLVEVTRCFCIPGEFNFSEVNSIVNVDKATQEHRKIFSKLAEQRSQRGLMRKFLLLFQGRSNRSSDSKDVSLCEEVEESKGSVKGKERKPEAGDNDEIVSQPFSSSTKGTDGSFESTELIEQGKIDNAEKQPLLEKDNQGSGSVIIPVQRLPLTKRLLNGRTIPIADSKSSSVIKYSDEFFRGIKDFTEFLWPATFYSLLAHDIGCYFIYPENRYGNTVKNILLGIPSNQQTLTTYPATFPLWWLMAFIPPIFGGLQVFNRYLSYCCLPEDEITRRLEGHRSSFLTDTIGWFINPFSKTKYSLRRAKRALLWDLDTYGEDKREEGKNLYLKAISEFSRNSSSLAKLEALATLTRIADIDIESYKKLGPNEQYKQLKKVRDQALQKLKRISKANLQENIIYRYYANYMLWSLGRSQDWLGLLFWLSISGLFYSKLRFGEMLIQSIYQDTKWLVDRHHCHQQNKVWSYISEFDKYECSVCGNWTNKDHVYYGNIFVAQSCLDDIFSTPRSAQEVLRILYRVRYFGFSKLDLSKQEWHNWSQQEWNNVLNVTNSSSQGRLTTLDLSRDVFNPVPLDPAKARLLAKVLDKVPTMEHLDLNNRGIGANATVALMESLTNKNIKYFDLSGNNIGIEGSSAVGRYLSNLPGLQTFKLSANGLTDDDIIQFASVFKNTTFRTLSLDGNEFGQRGIDRLAISFSDQLELLDLSNNDFTDIDLQSLGKYIATNPLKILRLASSNIGDVEFSSLIIFLPDSNLHSFDVSNNELTQASARSFAQVVNSTKLEDVKVSGNSFSDEGIAFVSPGLVNSTVRVFDISDNEIGDSGIWFFSKYLPQMQIEVLKLSKNRITKLGMADLALALTNSSVKDFDISMNNLEDTGVSELSRVLANPNSQMGKLNIAGNKITAQGISTLATVLRNNTVITRISLQNNLIGDIGIITITDTFTGSNISYVDFTNCEVTNLGLRKFAERLPATNLQTVRFGNNQLDSNSALEVAKVLITSVPHNNTLGDVRISRDQKWAIYNSQPRSKTVQLSLFGNNISTDGARAICRVLPSSGIPITNLNITDNPIDSNQVDMSNCWISPASSVRAPYVFVLVDTTIKNIFGIKEVTSLNPFLNSPSLNLTAYDQDFIPRHILGCRKYHILDRRESVIRSFAEIFNDQFANSFFPGNLIEYCLATVLAFRQEFFAYMESYLPEYLQKSLLQFANSSEGILLKDTSELMLRTKHSGTKTLLHDIIFILKEAHKQSKARDNSINGEQTDNEPGNVQAKQDEATWQSTIEKAASGLLSLGCIYGAAWAVGTITGNPLLGYLLMPVVINGRNIVSSIAQSYRNHGFFAAVEAGIDTVAISVPGGRLIGRALVEQQESLHRSFNYCNTGSI